MSGYPSGLTYRPIQRWPRELTRRRRKSPFSATLTSTLALLTKEIRELPARNVVLQVALHEGQLRKDGMPRADAYPEHPGVILSLETTNGAVSYPCDAFTRWEDNLRAIVLTIEKLRAIDRYGVTQNGEQYRGWMQIEAAVAMPKWTVATAWDALFSASEFRPDATVERRRVVRSALFRTHPDQGGSDEAFQRVIDAETFLRDAGAL